MNMYIPLLVVVLSNTVYHIAAKSTPASINAFASLSVTYAIGAVASLVLYFLTQKNADLLGEYHKINWSCFALGLSVVGLEAGFMWMYKAGWTIGAAQVVQSAILAIVLIFVGFFLFKEEITVRKIIGIAVCIAGLYMLNQ